MGGSERGEDMDPKDATEPLLACLSEQRTSDCEAVTPEHRVQFDTVATQGRQTQATKLESFGDDGQTESMTSSTAKKDTDDVLSDMERWYGGEDDQQHGVIIKAIQREHEKDKSIGSLAGPPRRGGRADSHANPYEEIRRATESINTRINLNKAAMYIRDCLIGHHYPFLDNKVHVYKLYRNDKLRALVSVAVVLNILLAMFHATNSSKHKAMTIFLAVCDVACLLVFVAHSALQYIFMGHKNFVAHRLCVAFLACNIIFALDLTLVPLIQGERPFKHTVMEGKGVFLRFYIRPIYACLHFGSLRRTIPNIIKTVTALLPVVLFIGIFIILFGIYGFMLFRHRNTYFASAPWSFYQLLITLTTSNFPDVMIQGYAHPWNVTSTGPITVELPERGNDVWMTEQRWYVFKNNSTPFDFSWKAFSWHSSPAFFILFYIIGLYFLLSVAFAIVYDIYKEHLKKEVLGMYAFRQQMLGKAFYYLTQHIDQGYDEFNKRMDRLQQQQQQQQHRHKHSKDGGESSGQSTPQLSPRSPHLDETSHTEMPAHEDVERMDALLHNFHDMAEEQKMLEKESAHRRSIMSPAIGWWRRQEGTPVPLRRRGTATTVRHTKGIDIYIFTLLYDELFPDFPKRDDKCLRKLTVGSIVSVVGNHILEGGKTVAHGEHGVVTNVTGHDEVEVYIGTLDYHWNAKPGEVVATDSWESRQKYIRVLFHAMDLDGSGKLDVRQFRSFYQMLQLKVKVVKDSRLLVERVLPKSIFESRCFQGVIQFGRSTLLTRIIDMCILGSVVYMTYHFTYVTNEDLHPANTLDHRWYNLMYLEVAIGLIFDLEVLIKVMSLGWVSYWSKKWNRFDFTITAINTAIYTAFGILAWIHGPERAVYMVMWIHNSDVKAEDSTPDLIMIVLLGRLLRTLRVLAEYRPFRYILKTASNLLPIFASYLLALGIVYYYFAVLGMVLFEGVVPPPGTAYSYNDYYALNFDSFYGACVTLWCLMVVNNWFIIVDGYRAAKGDWVMIYFVLFWLVSGLLMMNIVTAFIVEIWGSQWELNKEEAVNIDKHPLAQRIHALNNLHPEDGEKYYLLGLPHDKDGYRPVYKVSYGNYSHKVSLALERLFLNQKGVSHILPHDNGRRNGRKKTPRSPQHDSHVPPLQLGGTN